MTRSGRRWMAALLTALLPAGGCASGDTAGPSSISRAVEVDGLRFDLHANATENDGEVCVDLRVYRNSAPVEGQRECAATAIPAPAIGGYSAAVMAGGRDAYLWGLTGPGVTEVGLAGTTRRTPVTPIAAAPRASGCCGLFLLVISGPLLSNVLRLRAYDDGADVGGMDATVDGLRGA